MTNPADFGLEVLFEDNHVLIINKKASDISQGDKTGDIPLPEKIQAYWKEKYNKPGNVFCGVVHRLDRPTSGALIFTRTSKALERLSKQFREKEVNKTYWAIVENKPEKPEGTLIHFLKKNEKQNKSYAYNKEVEGSKKAILHYQLIGNSDKYYLLSVQLETGRHHQIRCQLGTIGCIIKGDVKYGAKRSNPDKSISLHARHVEFDHPVTKERILITAPVPADPLWLHFERTV
ncbi:MAG: RluA family pseudouridine synthase [Crocinitomicaceae bacterium]